MLTHTTRWSHPPSNAVVPCEWQATASADRRWGVLLPKLPPAGRGSLPRDVDPVFIRGEQEVDRQGRCWLPPNCQGTPESGA